MFRKRAESVGSYSKVAHFYDYLMRHVEYDRWYQYIIKLLNTYGIESKNILEIACGTGIMLEKFAIHGYHVFGMDASRIMLQEATRRIDSKYDSLFWCGDMRQFSVTPNFDAVICLYDSINYCMSINAFKQTLFNAVAALTPSGILIFDVCTIRNCKMNFRDYTETDGIGNIEYTRTARFDSIRNVQLNEFFVAMDTEDGQKYYIEKHVQQMYKLEKLASIIRQQDNMELIGIFDNFSKRPGSESSSRVHFVIRKR